MNTSIQFVIVLGSLICNAWKRELYFFVPSIRQCPFVAREAGNLFWCSLRIKQNQCALILFNRTRFITLGWQHTAAATPLIPIDCAINLRRQTLECSGPSQPSQTHLESFSLFVCHLEQAKMVFDRQEIGMRRSPWQIIRAVPLLVPFCQLRALSLHTHTYKMQAGPCCRRLCFVHCALSPS